MFSIVEKYILLSSILFFIGMAGILINRRSIINILMSIEVMLVAANINFVVFSMLKGDVYGHIFVLITLTVAAAEVAIGLAIMTLYYRQNKNIDVKDLNKLKN